MGRGNFPLQTFNRGRISRLALARTDLDRTRVSADRQTNWIPRTLGSMMHRPGLEYVENVQNNSSARVIPFIFAKPDTALLEVSTALRVLVDETPVLRFASTSAITGGDFTSTSLSGWTDADETGTTSQWVTGDFMALTGNRFARAIRRQRVDAVVGTTEKHGLAIEIERGRPVLKVGSSSGGDDYFRERTLRPGNYSLSINSTGEFWIEFSANTQYASLVKSVAIESSGEMSLPTPWASTDLDNLRWKQSQDVVFVAADGGYKQQRIERYSTESWSVVDFVADDGPFEVINITNSQITPSALVGEVTLDADTSVFSTGHLDALFEITSVGQKVSGTFTAADQFSDAIRVSGIDETRIFQILVDSHSSTEVTVRVQRSVGSSDSFVAVTGLAYTSTVSSTFDDGLDNQIAFYRIGIGSTDFGSTSAETVTAELSYGSGGITGIARVTDVVSSTQSSAIVLSPFGSTTPTDLWAEGSWSDLRGFPTSVEIHEGRIAFGGRARLYASVSDAFESFDQNTIGDSGPINRSVGSGPNDKIQWLLSLTRLLIGDEGREQQAKTSSLEEPLTPTNFAFRPVATQGSNNVQALQVDQRGIFVQSGGTRVYEVALNTAGLDFSAAKDLTILVPEIGEPEIIRAAIQRQPDTRLHFVRSDGTVAMLIYDPAEEVSAWVDIETDGAIEDVAVLPGDIEDKVYYVVKRTINGATVRFLERLAMESEARGAALTKLSDACLVQNSSLPTTTITSTHLAGSSVTVWGNGKDLGSFTCSSNGTVSVSTGSTTFIVGLPYDATFESVKLSYAAQRGTALTQRKKIDHVGVVLADTHALGLKYGGSTSVLDDLPLMDRSRSVSTDEVFTGRDTDPTMFPGDWGPDSRLVLYSPPNRPATVLGAVIGMEVKEKS